MGKRRLGKMESRDVFKELAQLGPLAPMGTGRRKQQDILSSELKRRKKLNMI
jgi:hypothetical protein